MRRISGLSFWFVSAFDIRALSLDFEIPRLRHMAQRKKSKARRVHHQHRDETCEKNEQHNSQCNENSSAHRVILLLLAPERGCTAQMRRLCASFRKVSLDLLRLRQRL